ncbi:unnamed protein product, partial [Closterium sp. NIES-54]
LNDWLSLGQHRVWKRMTVGWSRWGGGRVKGRGGEERRGWVSGRSEGVRERAGAFGENDCGDLSLVLANHSGISLPHLLPPSPPLPFPFIQSTPRRHRVGHLLWQRRSLLGAG